MIDNFKNKNSLEKCDFKIWIKRIVLLVISIMIVMLINPPIKRYTIKDYDKYAKENNIEYEIEKCPRCGAEVANDMDFCYECNIILHTTDEGRIQLLDYITEQTNKNLESRVKEKRRNKIIFYIIADIAVYLLLQNSLKFIQKLYIKNKKEI